MESGNDLSVNVPEFLQNRLSIQAIPPHSKMSDGNSTLSQVLIKLRKLQLKLADAHKLVPSVLMIEGVSQEELKHPLFCGSYGDVYCTKWHGQVVALKKMRVFQSHKILECARNVSRI
jgi:hypothetical protein